MEAWVTDVTAKKRNKLHHGSFWLQHCSYAGGVRNTLTSNINRTRYLLHKLHLIWIQPRDVGFTASENISSHMCCLMDTWWPAGKSKLCCIFAVGLEEVSVETYNSWESGSQVVGSGTDDILDWQGKESGKWAGRRIYVKLLCIYLCTMLPKIKAFFAFACQTHAGEAPGEFENGTIKRIGSRKCWSHYPYWRNAFQDSHLQFFFSFFFFFVWLQVSSVKVLLSKSQSEGMTKSEGKRCK